MSRLLSTSLTAGTEAVPRVVGGEGVYFELADGRRIIDASNTAAPLGHRHPEMIAAVRDAVDSPAVNEGWSWQARQEAADELVRESLLDADWIGGVRFFLSASEANDAVLALAQALTGRSDLATRERAYHGGSGFARDLTVQPHWHGGLSSASQPIRPVPRSVTVHELPAPTSARVTGQPDPTAGGHWKPAALRALRSSAAVLLDYSQGGIYHSPAYQDEVAALAKEAGALWIADETVTGFGRVGGWMQFHQGTAVPDAVTMGKCLAAGSSPAGAVVFSRELLERLDGSSWQTYSTFRGHPITVAAIAAHVRISARDRIFERAATFDAAMLASLTEIAERHPSVRRIDGRGLHWTIELHGPDWQTWRGQEEEPIASRVAATALREGVLLATSGEQTSFFIAPPLIVEHEHLDRILSAVDAGLAVADRALVKLQLA